MSEEPLKHLWPSSLQRIAEDCGDEIALDLWRHYPGVRVYIPTPENLPPEHPLAQKIGLESALKLSRCYPGGNILVAKAYEARIVMRNFVIRKLNREGATYAELGVKYDLTDRQIYSICTAEGLRPNKQKSTERDERQIDLFAFKNN